MSDQRLKKVEIFILLLFLAIAIPACSKDSILEKDWLCLITAPESEKCQNIAVITSGELLLGSDGSFKLEAVFDACYERIEARVSGKVYAQIALNKVVEIELLAEKIEQSVSDQKGEKKTHPRTIGFINLERETGRGSYSDVWEVIRMKGLYQQPVVNRAMQCESVGK